MNLAARSITILIALGLVAASVTADMTVTLSRGYGNGPGGEFIVTPSGFPDSPAPVGLAGDGTFETFCVERNEYIWFNATFFVTLNDSAVEGGGGPNPDPLDSKTAYLYEQFVTGDLASYDYADTTFLGRDGSANALQDVIWYFEQEKARFWANGSLADMFYHDALDNAPDDIGDVMIMNLYSDAARTQLQQDQLVYIPQPIPAPGAAVLAMMGMGMVGWVKRR